MGSLPCATRPQQQQHTSYNITPTTTSQTWHHQQSELLLLSSLPSSSHLALPRWRRPKARTTSRRHRGPYSWTVGPQTPSASPTCSCILALSSSLPSLPSPSSASSMVLVTVELLGTLNLPFMTPATLHTSRLMQSPALYTMASSGTKKPDRSLRR